MVNERNPNISKRGSIFLAHGIRMEEGTGWNSLQYIGSTPLLHLPGRMPEQGLRPLSLSSWLLDNVNDSQELFYLSIRLICSAGTCAYSVLWSHIGSVFFFFMTIWFAVIFQTSFFFQVQLLGGVGSVWWEGSGFTYESFFVFCLYKERGIPCRGRRGEQALLGSGLT